MQKAKGVVRMLGSVLYILTKSCSTEWSKSMGFYEYSTLETPRRWGGQVGLLEELNLVVPWYKQGN